MPRDEKKPGLAEPSGSRHGSSARMQEWPFEALGVDAVFAGHNHIYERLRLDENADGVLVPYFVSGLGGKSANLSALGDPIEGSEVQYAAERGSMIVSASETSVEFKFYTANGTLIDRLTIP